MSTLQPSHRTWLKTNHPVIPVNPAVGNHHLAEVESALRAGVVALPDARRPGFYDIETGESWYYIHISNRIDGVYLIAAGRRTPEYASKLLACCQAS